MSLRISRSTRHFAFALAATTFIGIAVPAAAQTPPQKPCVAPLGWWESKGLMPFFVKPGGPAPQNNCDFQLWSWSAMVHFMQPNPKTVAPLFLSLPVYDDLVSDKSGITALKSLPPVHTLALRPRNAQPKSLGSFKQAGPGGVLGDQNGRAVYYATHMDLGYFNFTQTYFGPNAYKKAAPTLNYPVGATVIKSSWRIVAPNETVTDAYTTTATIALLESDGKGKLQASGKTQGGVKVALVGVHVVGVLNDHPEFSWATFEHLNNAPDLPPDGDPNSPNPVSAQSYTFYKGGTPANASNHMAKTMTIDPASQVIAPVTNVFQQFQYGGATPPTRIVDIDSINANFMGKIKEQKPTVIDPVFANYRLTGTLWMLPNTLKPGDGGMDEEAIGSIDLDNATLETFVQGEGANCFMCHTTAGHGTAYPGKNINTSHIITSVIKPDPAIQKAR